MKKLKLTILFTCSLFVNISFAQDLLAELEKDTPVEPRFATATFKSTRVINQHSVETVGKGVLDFRISHRFGKINSGAYNLFGLDQSTIRLGLEYGLSNRIMIGVGRSSFNKHYDGFVKVKLLRQRNDALKNMPVTVVWFSNMGINSLKFDDTQGDRDFASRLAYTHQLIVGRKFSDRLSLQLAPTVVHRNHIQTEAEQSDVYALGAGGRIKLSKRVSVNADYFYLLPETAPAGVKNSLSLGFDIETGGHVFQLHVTNSKGMVEQYFIPGTVDSWSKGEIFYGFNISRQFTLVKSHK
ncbi:hypothetical protein GXP67_18460 [Rhodocytophaga rosea]|uniref:DUF5777 domain-containing protein n=1 Tax=Rhodocytophaga rosea TaxID=2704465 RepID=A0A6C0GKZ4_9BACT|nr:DUF5777 family beta-barrel protein [Rhodocytophaga rosea]QHT68484.1 hypothetical protein GXP67_18460 [Rhodocytophaga rosea]